jgi:ubiquinone/menaquinone biosynthesis C-methylase UbiE
MRMKRLLGQNAAEHCAPADRLNRNDFTNRLRADRHTASECGTLQTAAELHRSAASSPKETMMSAAGSYSLPASERDAQAEIKRLAAQAHGGWDKESRMLSWFGLKDGISVLELGSGPGFITEQLVTLVPTSPITCVEIDRTLLDQAERHLQHKANQRVRFVEGSVMDTHLASDRFDFAYARLLFQHLRDPLGAAKEIRRVLKPGGKLVIYDIDDELFGLFQPPLPEFASVLKAFGQAQAARGGNRHIGRSLSGILNAAGFGTIEVEVVATHSVERGVEPYLQHIHPDRMRSLVTSGLLTEEELEGYRAALTAWAALPDAYTLWLSLMVCGEKPYQD